MYIVKVYIDIHIGTIFYLSRCGKANRKQLNGKTNFRTKEKIKTWKCCDVIPCAGLVHDVEFSKSYTLYVTQYISVYNSKIEALHNKTFVCIIVIFIFYIPTLHYIYIIYTVYIIYFWMMKLRRSASCRHLVSSM